MAQIIVWGVIDKNGNVVSGSVNSNGQYNFAVNHAGGGTYNITFSPPFSSLPAITGAQWGFGGTQSTLDNVVFPGLSQQGATAFTGDSGGRRTDRNFSFNAVGFVNMPP